MTAKLYRGHRSIAALRDGAAAKKRVAFARSKVALGRWWAAPPPRASSQQKPLSEFGSLEMSCTIPVRGSENEADGSRKDKLLQGTNLWWRYSRTAVAPCSSLFRARQSPPEVRADGARIPRRERAVCLCCQGHNRGEDSALRRARALSVALPAIQATRIHSHTARRESGCGLGEARVGIACRFLETHLGENGSRFGFSPHTKAVVTMPPRHRLHVSAPYILFAVLDSGRDG